MTRSGWYLEWLAWLLQRRKQLRWDCRMNVVDGTLIFTMAGPCTMIGARFCHRTICKGFGAGLDGNLRYCSLFRIRIWRVSMLPRFFLKLFDVIRHFQSFKPLWSPIRISFSLSPSVFVSGCLNDRHCTTLANRASAPSWCYLCAPLLPAFCSLSVFKYLQTKYSQITTLFVNLSRGFATSAVNALPLTSLRANRAILVTLMQM